MDLQKKRILNLVPAIRMIMSGQSLKSGSFIFLNQLTVTDPVKISARLGQAVSVFSGSTEKVLKEISATKDDIGDYLFIEGLGLLGLSANKSGVDKELGEIRKESRMDISEFVTVPPVNKHLYNKVIVITGGAMGIGEGIARKLFNEGANVVIYDINNESGKLVASELNRQKTLNRAYFIRADVTNHESVADAVFETVLEFSGLDVMISNAGVLKAGGIDEMDPDTFDFVCRVNYQGYYNCVRAAVPVMKLQNQYASANYGDIIQINSKSGLEGSKKNFAYSGSKFGGIGLTQSFAIELIADRIKVNAICPGNYFDGPLWSDPEHGLFVQYLRTGKVPGAKTIDDVRQHYESMVPAGRGCRIEDVIKAIKYVIDQEYETGQAVPVTGGQVMLS